MKLTNTQWVIIAGAAGVMIWAMSRMTEPLSLAGLYRTIMPNAPTDAQRAAMFAARAGRTPSSAGTSGTGATSTQPVYAGLLAGIGSAVGGLVRQLRAPGNAAPAQSPQSSASSGGGVSQPPLGFTQIFDPDVYFGWGDVYDDWYTPGLPSGQYGPMDPSVIVAPGIPMGDTSFDPFAGFAPDEVYIQA